MCTPSVTNVHVPVRYATCLARQSRRTATGISRSLSRSIQIARGRMVDTPYVAPRVMKAIFESFAGHSLKIWNNDRHCSNYSCKLCLCIIVLSIVVNLVLQ